MSLDRPRAPDGSRVLLCLPAGRDGTLAATLLRDAGLNARAVPSVEALASELDHEVGVALLASEAASTPGWTLLTQALQRQPPWSDLPVIWLSRGGRGPSSPSDGILDQLRTAAGNVLVLERPMGGASLVSAVQSGLRARARQFELREQLAAAAAQTQALQRSQEALRDSEAKFRGITNSVDQMIWSTRPDGYHDYYNDRWYDFTGVPPGSTDGEGWNDLFHPDDQRRAWDVWRHSLRTGEPYRIEYRLRHRSGQYRWVLGRAKAVVGVDGQISRWFGSCTDIQDLVAAREVLARSRDELERLVLLRTQERDGIWQASGDLLGVASTDGVWLAVNPAWQVTLGWPHDAIVGRRADWLTHPDDLSATAAEIEALSRGDVARSFVNRLRRRDGHYRALAWTAVPRDGRLYCVARDITEERERAAALQAAEEQLRQSQKMEAVGQLTGGIAHDFNNLLQAISGSLAVGRKRLQRGQPQDVEEFIERAMRATQRAARLTHRLLAFSRQQPLAPAAVDLNELVLSSTDLIRNALGENVALELGLQPALPPASCDRNQLENALLNLVINARDAMPNGGQLRLSSFEGRGQAHGPPLQADDSYVGLKVTDTGTGMSPEVRERAFDPFYTTKPLGQGTGLGLSMIYGFAQQSGGVCSIDSVVGRGTEVTLWLPVAAGSMVPAEQPQELPAPAVLARSARVLVVEDEELVRHLVVQSLQELGLQVLQAGDGAAGLALVRSSPPLDLLLTDVGLPGLNGRQLAEAARDLQPGLKVLMMSGYMPGTDSAAVDLPPHTTLITKPFELEALAALVARLLSPAVGDTRQ